MYTDIHDRVLQVKQSAVSATKIAATAVAQAKLITDANTKLVQGVKAASK